MDIKPSCRYFRGDRPCRYYWKTLKLCDNCQFFDQIKERILIIKQDASGDVLRATPILRALKNKYPKSFITWVVGKAALPLIQHNPLIDRVVVFDQESLLRFFTEKFDLAINLDKDAKSTSLMEIVSAKNKKGYGLSPEGTVYPINKGARYHYEICLDNYGLKKKNKKSYVEMLFDIIEIPFNGEKYILEIPEENKKWAESFLKDKKLTGKKIIGFNTGCGRAYPHKKWAEQHYSETIKSLAKNREVAVLLFGGPDEEQLNKRIELGSDGMAINTGSENSVLNFAALIGCCDLILTGDTLGMHIALALDKPSIALFGPTPYQEIYPYDSMTRIEAKIECTCCYDQFPCPKNPNCMEIISPKQVLDIINKKLKL